MSVCGYVHVVVCECVVVYRLVVTVCVCSCGCVCAYVLRLCVCAVMCVWLCMSVCGHVVMGVAVYECVWFRVCGCV